VVFSKKPAEELGLPPGIPVAEAGRIRWWYSGSECAGSRQDRPHYKAHHTLFFGVSAQAIYGAGFFGAFTDAVVPGQYVVEGGQVSTGSIVKWFQDNFCGGLLEEANRQGLGLYELLNKRAENLPVGSDGLIVLDLLARKPQSLY